MVFGQDQIKDKMWGGIRNHSGHMPWDSGTILILKTAQKTFPASNNWQTDCFFSSALLYLILWICLERVSGNSRRDGESFVFVCCWWHDVNVCCFSVFWFLWKLQCPEAECCSVVQSNPSITPNVSVFLHRSSVLPSFLRPKCNRKASSAGVLTHFIIRQNTGTL